MAAAAAQLLSLAAYAYMSVISHRETETRRMFVEWKAKYDKAYASVAEEECRYAVFRETRRAVDQHNAGFHSYRVGLNMSADLTEDDAPPPPPPGCVLGEKEAELIQQGLARLHPL